MTQNNKSTNDNVNHPSHYNTGKYEVIDVIEDWDLDFALGNAVKYIARAGKKDKSKYSEDLEKAIFYLRRAIDINKTSEVKQGCDADGDKVVIKTDNPNKIDIREIFYNGNWHKL